MISKKDLEKLVLKACSLDKSFKDFLIINYIDQESGEKELFEQAKNDIFALAYKRYKGFSNELKMANYLAACNKRIMEFSKTCKDKSLEMDLIIMVLDMAFKDKSCGFGTCFTQYNHKVYLLVKKAMTLLTKKLHVDHRLDYEKKVNQYLTQISRE